MTWARFAYAAEHAEDAGAGSAVAPAAEAAACHPAVTAVLPDPDCWLNPVVAADTDQEWDQDMHVALLEKQHLVMRQTVVAWTAAMTHQMGSGAAAAAAAARAIAVMMRFGQFPVALALVLSSWTQKQQMDHGLSQTTSVPKRSESQMILSAAAAAAAAVVAGVEVTVALLVVGWGLEFCWPALYQRLAAWGQWEVRRMSEATAEGLLLAQAGLVWLYVLPVGEDSTIWIGVNCIKA
jgi:hypothetical protein